MKKLCSFVLLFFAIASSIIAETPIKSKIEQVVVFRGGAQIKRTGKVSLKAGSNTIVFGNLPAGYDESSIQIKSNAKAEIISITFRKNFEDDFESNPTYKTWKDQLETIIRKKDNETLIYETWKEEESLLISNKKVSGENSGLSSEQLTKVADLYRTRLLLVKQQALESRRKLNDYDKEISKIQSTINEWTGKNKTINNGEIVIDLMSKNAVEDVFEVSYIDNRASWTSSFDLRLESLKQPLNLISKGKITQSTGENWDDVKITLSSGDPRRNMQLPEIKPWFLYYYVEQYNQTKLGAYNNAAQLRGSKDAASNYYAEGAVKSELDDVVSRENIAFMEYALPNRMDIPSDSKPHEVKMNEVSLDAKYDYIASPKLDTKVYLQASISDWSQNNFSSGEVKLYFEGTYVGNTYLDAAAVEDTMKISLGPDIALSTKREKLKDFKKTTFLSSKKQLQSGYEITIKNNKPGPVEMTIYDQIPLASDSQMEIEAEDLSGGKLNKETGIVEWKISLKPGEQIKKRIIYNVKIPKDKKISL